MSTHIMENPAKKSAIIGPAMLTLYWQVHAYARKDGIMMNMADRRNSQREDLLESHRYGLLPPIELVKRICKGGRCFQRISSYIPPIRNSPRAR